MSESRDWIRAQLGGDRAGSEAPSAEQQAYLEGAPGADDEVDEQDEEAEPADEVELPDVWPSDFWSALTPQAQAEFERGDHDLVEEYQLWATGQVDAGEGDDYEEMPDAPPAELPPTADEAMTYSQEFAAFAQAGGDEEWSVAAALEASDAWAMQAREIAIAEVNAGRRQSWDLAPGDEAAFLQARVNAKVAAAKAARGES